MANKVFTIATRQSPLALWQANHIADRLRALHPGLLVELQTFVTQGDKILDSPLAKIGGKGLFVKELEQALLEGRADLAVHSIKDVPMELPAGLHMPVITERETPWDAWVSNRYNHINDLPVGAVVGTSSVRRRAQLLAWRPDLQINDLRGNVGTRLAKLDADGYDGIILAAAGLERLAQHSRIRHYLDSSLSLPAVGQGALGLECRVDDATTANLIAPLLHADSCDAVRAERACNRMLMGGCQVRIAVYATCAGDQLQLQALVASLDGSQVLTAELTGTRLDPELLGRQLAEQLIAKGALQLLATPP